MDRLSRPADEHQACHAKHHNEHRMPSLISDRCRSWLTNKAPGATGLASGCVRNLYMTPPLLAILRAGAEVWESDPVNLGFQQVGYVSVGEAN